MEFFNADVGWLFFAYTVGTAFGWYFGFRAKALDLSEAVIDSLIEQGFLKTRGTGRNMEIIPWKEWCEEK